MGSPLGDDDLVERVYEALHPALWPLVPWMTQNKVDVYLYSGRETLLKGRFNPPPWSGGLMSDSPTRRPSRSTRPSIRPRRRTSSRTCNFHAFFDESRAIAQLKLDEGLAVMLQDDALSKPDPREKARFCRADPDASVLEIASRAGHTWRARDGLVPAVR